MTESLEFVNDWSELEAAVDHLVNGELYEYEWGESPISQRTYEAINTLSIYVPRLLTQYAKLLELSFTLTDAWEAEHAHKTPEGLYLP